MLRFLSLLLVIGLSGCASSSPEPKAVWIRTDGQSLTANPTLAQQIEIDKTICYGEGAKARLNSSTPEGSFTGWTGPLASQVRAKDVQTAVTGCMAGKGYVSVPEEIAEAQRQQFAADAAAKQAQEAPPPPAPKKPRKIPPAATPGR